MAKLTCEPVELKIKSADGGVRTVLLEITAKSWAWADDQVGNRLTQSIPQWGSSLALSSLIVAAGMRKTSPASTRAKVIDWVDEGLIDSAAVCTAGTLAGLEYMVATGVLTRADVDSIRGDLIVAPSGEAPAPPAGAASPT